MAVVSSTNLRLFTGDAPVEPPSPVRLPAESPQDAADRLYAREAFRTPPANRRDDAPEPYTLSWFDRIAEQRYGRQGYWLPKQLEFRRHAGEIVLCLGEGLGTDGLQYAQNGATVLTASPSQEQLGLVRRNFELHGQSGRYLHAPPHALPVDEDSIDVACAFGLLHEVERPEAVIAELYRVLRPGGKAIVVAPAKYDAAFWLDACYPWRRWWRSRPLPEAGRRAATARSLRRDFTAFAEHKVAKRHLRRLHLPHLWRMLPLPLTERFCGQYLILKAFKPVSAALAELAAA